jgi:hypothetical protein
MIYIFNGLLVRMLRMLNVCNAVYTQINILLISNRSLKKSVTAFITFNEMLFRGMEF